MNFKPSIVELKISSWLPTRGNVLFTVVFTSLVLGSFVLAGRAGALPGFQTDAPSGASTSLIAYQGRLADAAGAPLTGSYPMTFALYTAATGGAALWSESRTVTATDGVFSVMLGEATPIPASIAANTSLYLGVTVGSDAEMTPRKQLGSVAYAFQAITVPDRSITSAKIADGAIVTGRTTLTYVSKQLGYFETSSTTFVDVPSSDVSITVDAPSVLLVSFTGSLWAGLQANQHASARLTISVDGVDRTDLVNQVIEASSGTTGMPNPAIAPASLTVPVTVGAGSHTVKLRILSSSYDPSYRWAGIGWSNQSSMFSVMVFRQ